MNRTKLVRMPIDILQSLEMEYPNTSNPQRFRNMFASHIEIKETKLKLDKVGTFVYGQMWKNKFK